MRDLKEKLMEKLVDEVCKQASKYAEANGCLFWAFDEVEIPEKLLEDEMDLS